MKRITLFAPKVGLLLAAIFFVVLGCDRAIQPQELGTVHSKARIRINQTITQVVVNSPNFTLLEAAVLRTGLADALSSGNLTVFAPSDAAFRAAGFPDVNAINNADVNTLRRILTYHVIGTERYFSERIPEALTGFTTLQGEQLQISRRNGISVNGIAVSQADLEANNGVIHVIETVLLPPAGNTVEVAVANPNLSYLVAALQRAGLVQTIATGGPFTVFAPTNAAFQAAGFPTIASIQAADPNVLSRILRYHVVAGRRFSSLLSDGGLQSLMGNALQATQTPGGAIIQGLGNSSPATVQAANVITLNGVVHVIDQVLLPDGAPTTKSITSIVVDGANFTLLEAAVIRAGLAGALSMGNLTVFAPTDDAFRAAGFPDVNAINNADVNTLRKILTYHVIGDRYPSTIFTDRITGFTTLQGDQVQVVRQGPISVNGVSVIQADVPATNGVIHVINQVLLPLGGNTAEVAIANPNLSYLVAALQRAGLVQTIATGGPFTVFAPTNAAFQAAGFPTIASIQAADPAVLTRILTYHVVSGRVFSTMIRSGEVGTLQGGVLMASTVPGITVQGKSNTTASNVVAANVATLNGVVHVIDQVLLP